MSHVPVLGMLSPNTPKVKTPSMAQVTPPPPVPMPDIGDVQAQKEREKKYAASLQGGRASTILSSAGGQKLGG